LEVHQHTHSLPVSHQGRKKWTHYFWEFLMLFLAIFCGFMAENFREHQVEKHRAGQLARSLYEEIREDSLTMAIRVQSRLRQEASLKWLMSYFKDSSLSHFPKSFSIHYLYGVHFRTPSIFEARTVVLDQLKNSGSLRYFKSQKLQELIGQISVAVLQIRDRQEIETQIRNQFIHPFTISHYDYDFDAGITKDGTLLFRDAVAEYEKSSDTIPFRFKNADHLDREYTINILGIYGMSAMRATRQQHFQRYIDLNAELLKELRKEYHFK